MGENMRSPRPLSPMSEVRPFSGAESATWMRMASAADFHVCAQSGGDGQGRSSSRPRPDGFRMQLTRRLASRAAAIDRCM